MDGPFGKRKTKLLVKWFQKISIMLFHISSLVFFLIAFFIYSKAVKKIRLNMCLFLQPNLYSTSTCTRVAQNKKKWTEKDFSQEWLQKHVNF